MLTITTFNDILENDIKNIKVVIFDIDGTVSSKEIIYCIIKTTFSHFNLELMKMPQLGKEKFNIEWIRNELKIEISVAIKIFNYYENLFYATKQNEFIKNIYSDVIPFLEKLRKKNILIGFFTLRQIYLALAQIEKMGLLEYIYVNDTIKENKGLQISGSNNNRQLSSLDEKANQLKFHSDHLVHFTKSNFLVIGDSLETDMYAAKQMEFKHFLISR